MENPPLWITWAPDRAKKIPKTTCLNNSLFKNTASIRTVKTGATVPKIVALATDVSLTALKKQAK